MTSQSQLLLKLMKAKGYHNTLMDNFIQNNLPDAQRTALSIQVISYRKTGAQYRDKCWWNVLETTEVVQLKIKTNGQRRKFRGSWHKYPQKINVIQDCRFFFSAFDSLWQHSMLMIICFHLCRFLWFLFSFLLLYFSCIRCASVWQNKFKLPLSFWLLLDKGSTAPNCFKMDQMLNQLVVGQPVLFHYFPDMSYVHQSQSKAAEEMNL